MVQTKMKACNFAYIFVYTVTEIEQHLLLHTCFHLCLGLDIFSFFDIAKNNSSLSQNLHFDIKYVDKFGHLNIYSYIITVGLSIKPVRFFKLVLLRILTNNTVQNLSHQYFGIVDLYGIDIHLFICHVLCLLTKKYKGKYVISLM